MSIKRRDSKNRVLRTGESQKKMVGICISTPTMKEKLNMYRIQRSGCGK